MSTRERKRIRVDWEELHDAFEDSSTDHRYYLDRETGAVHFFSAYLDNEDEEEDERAMSSEARYVVIPHVRRAVPEQDLAGFVASLTDSEERRLLTTALRTQGSYQRFVEAVEVLPSARKEWRQYAHDNLKARISEWLSEVGVEPL